MNQMGVVRTDKGQVDVFFNQKVSIGIKSPAGMSIIALSPEQAMGLVDLLARAAETIDPHVRVSEWVKLMAEDK